MTADNAMPPEHAVRLDLVKQRYGPHLTAEQWAEVEKGLEAITQAVQALRAVKLDNADEPGTIFVPYRQEG